MPHASAVGNLATPRWPRVFGGRVPDKFVYSPRTTRPAPTAFSCGPPVLGTHRVSLAHASLLGTSARSGGLPAISEPPPIAASPIAHSVPGPSVPFGSSATVLNNSLARARDSETPCMRRRLAEPVRTNCPRRRSRSIARFTVASRFGSR